MTELGRIAEFLKPLPVPHASPGGLCYGAIGR